MFKWLRRFWERGRKGYCYEDLWDFNNWLSAMLARGLREFKETTHTYPNECKDWEDWMSMLDEMIDCFEEQGRGTDNLIHGGIEKWNEIRAIQKKKLHRGLELLEKYYYDLWD